MRRLANSMYLRIGLSFLGGVVVGVVLALLGHPAVAVMAAWATLATRGARCPGPQFTGDMSPCVA